MENNLSASEQLALLQPTAASPTPQETVTSRALSFVPPSVSGARAELNQVQNIIRDAETRRLNTGENLSPFRPGPSLSQQVSDESAVQDKMIVDAYARAGVKLSPTDLSSMQAQLQNNPTIKEIDPTFLYERRVADAYKNIGREGTAVDREGTNFFLNKLKSGEISPENFDKEFLNMAANYTGPGASSLLDSINKARTDLKMTPLNTTQLAAAQAAAAAGQVPGAVTPTTPAPTTLATTAVTPEEADKQVLRDIFKKPSPSPVSIPTDITKPLPPLNPTREQVLAAFANNPRAVRVPDPEAINFFMQPGNLGNFDAIVEQVRTANPGLAAEIDKDRFVPPKASTNPFQQYINPGMPTNPFQQYIDPKVSTNPYQGYTPVFRDGGPVKK